MNQPYSELYFPPMPVLDVALAASEENNWTDPLPAIIDTGADFCIAPSSVIRKLKPRLVRPALLSSHWRDTYSVAIYSVDIRIGASVQPAVMIASDPRSREILLGRNLLNRLNLRLDGLKSRTHLLRA